MSDPTPTMDAELTDLFEGVANRDLTPDQQARLAQRLSADAGARAAFIQATAFDAMLSHEFPSPEPNVASSALQIGEAEQEGPDRSSAASKPSRRLRPGHALAALALVTAASLAVLFLGPGEPNAPIARIAYQANARWASKERSQGDAIGIGSQQLDVGVARLDFANGATVTLQGPAQFEILSPDQTRLSHGILTAHVPESAIGFEVLTPSLDVVDLGTAFGVAVGADGETDVCVFEGEVEVSRPSAGARESTRLLSEGNTVRWDPEAQEMASVDFDTNRYEEAWPVTSGVLQATGLMKFVAPGPGFAPGHYEDNERVLVFLERTEVVPKKDFFVDLVEPGQYQRIHRSASHRIQAGTRLRSYLLQLDPVGRLAREATNKPRVMGQVTFDGPVIGVIASSGKLSATDRLLGHPRGDYVKTRRGIEPPRSTDTPDSGRDVVILSNDRRTLSVDLSAGTAIDQIRILVEK